MANPNTAVRSARQKVGHSETHMRQMEEARDRRLEESPFVAVMRRVQDGEMTADEGAEEVRRMQAEGL